MPSKVNTSALEFVAEQTGDIFIRAGVDGLVLYVSGSIRNYGYEPEDIVGTSALWLVHPDDYTRYVANNHAIWDGERLSPDGRVHRYRTADGRWVWLEGNPRLIRDAQGRVIEMVNVLRDVTARREAELHLAEQTELVRSAFEHSGVGKAIIGLDSRVISINAAFCELVGYSRDHMVGLDYRTITVADDLDNDRELLDQLNSGAISNYRIDKRYVRADGAVVWGEATISAVRDQAGAPKFYVAQVQDRTQQRATEMALQESEARYRLLTENAGDVIACFGTDTRFTYLSPSVKSVLGYAPEELIGQPTQSIMHPDDYKTSLEVYSDHLAGPAPSAPFHFEYRAFHKNGSLVWLAAHPRAVFDPVSGELTGFQDVVRDVTARRDAEAALAEREALFRLLAENANDLIMQSSPDGVITYLSPSSFATTGFRPEEVIGQSPLGLIHPDDHQVVMDAVRDQIASRGGIPPRHIEYRMLTRDGREIWMESSPRANLDPSTGEVASITDAGRDITARKALEDGLWEAREAAEAAARVKADFMANMSHEIRTPLTAILGFTSLLGARTDLAEEARQQLGRIAGAGQALLTLVNDVLDFSKLEAGQMTMKPRAAALGEAAAEALALFEPQAAAKGVSLTLEGGETLPVAWVDPDRLRQVLLNLVGNAVKFTSEGGVILRAGYDDAAQRLRFEVMDSGPGMSADQQASLFQRFSQVDASTTRRHGGTGLGLAICRGLVDAMGGDIGVNSEIGRGSTFWFEIDAPVAEAVEAEAEAEMATLAGVRVLVADDNPVNRELVRRLLNQLDAEVTEASDGAEAVERAGQEAFDVILMDIRMPGLDGADAAMRIRRREGPNRDAPILAFTADFDLERYGEQVGQAFDGVVCKPINACELIDAIAGSCRREPADVPVAAAAVG